MALGVLVGLLALVVGIARFAFLGRFIAMAFAGATAGELAVPFAATAAAILLRAWLDHARAMLAHRRATGQSTHPFFWGAFVAAGDWR